MVGTIQGAKNDEKNEGRWHGEDDEIHEGPTPPWDDVRTPYRPDYGVGNFFKTLTYLAVSFAFFISFRLVL